MVYSNLVRKDPSFPCLREKRTALKWQDPINTMKNKLWPDRTEHKKIVHSSELKYSPSSNPLLPLNLLSCFLTKTQMFLRDSLRDSVFYALLGILPRDVVTFSMIYKVLGACCWVHNAISCLGSISLWDLLALHNHGSLCFSWPCLPRCSSP